MKKVIIIGGGAAGFFAATNIKLLSPALEVEILEAASRPLRKVLISGGGRCNITNSFESGLPLKRIYPRGEKLMRALLRRFDNTSTQEWFESRGVKLTVQDDGCLFPCSQSAAEVVECLKRSAREAGVVVRTKQRVDRILKKDGKFSLLLTGGEQRNSDIVVATIGGQPQRSGLTLYDDLPLEIIAPNPSLFSFTIPREPITELMGAVVQGVTLTLKGSSLRASGDMLITHWGISGPAVLKLSAYAARELKQSEYRATVVIGWLGDRKESDLREELQQLLEQNQRKLITAARPTGLTARVWGHILSRAEISLERRCAEIGSKGFNRIVSLLIHDEYRVEGRGSHREEFVTAGGVSLASIDARTLEAKHCEGLYLAGETLDVDGITGGYNLQAAWSMGYVVAESIAAKATQILSN